MFNLADFIDRAIRVMNVFNRPKREEFVRMARITALGIVIVGILGLAVSMIFNFI